VQSNSSFFYIVKSNSSFLYIVQSVRRYRPRTTKQTQRWRWLRQTLQILRGEPPLPQQTGHLNIEQCPQPSIVQSDGSILDIVQCNNSFLSIVQSFQRDRLRPKQRTQRWRWQTPRSR
jgi:hypothetical protein